MTELSVYFLLGKICAERVIKVTSMISMSREKKGHANNDMLIIYHSSPDSLTNIFLIFKFFKNWLITRRNLTHNILQCLDVVPGAMSFKLNRSTFGVPKVEKFEIRISKSETNPNFLMIK